MNIYMTLLNYSAKIVQFYSQIIVYEISIFTLDAKNKQMGYFLYDIYVLCH
jgi:hypothetical protein